MSFTCQADEELTWKARSANESCRGVILSGQRRCLWQVAHLKQQLKIEEDIVTNLEIVRRACVLMKGEFKNMSQGRTLHQQADEIFQVVGQPVKNFKARSALQSDFYEKIDKLEWKWGRSDSEDYPERLRHVCTTLGMQKDFADFKSKRFSCHCLADRCLAKSGGEEISKVKMEIREACSELKNSLDQEFNVEGKVEEYMKLAQRGRHTRCEEDVDAVKWHVIEVVKGELQTIDDVATSDTTPSFERALAQLPHVISVLAFVSQVSDEEKSISKQFWQVLNGMDQKIKRLGTKNAAEVAELFYPVLQKAAAEHPSFFTGRLHFDYESQAQGIRQDP